MQSSSQQNTVKELQEYKVYLAEAQEELQQLQVQLVLSKRATATSAAAVAALTQQLQEVEELNIKLQQELAGNACAQQQLPDLQLQLAASKQQLTAATEASAAQEQQLQHYKDRLLLQEAQHKEQEQQIAQQLAISKSQTAAVKAEVRELRRSEAAASQQLSALTADLEAARAAEKAALADARRARAAESSRAKQLREADEELSKCREQLALASDIHSQLSRLQSALQEQRRQQRSSQADAEQSREQQTALVAELCQYKAMLSEAQEEVARLEGDSRELHALRRRSGNNTPTMLNHAQPQTVQGLCSYTSHSTTEPPASITCDHSASGRRTECSGHEQQQQQHLVSNDLDEEYMCKAAAAQQYSKFKLLTQLCIPDTPSRLQGITVTPCQAAAAASPGTAGAAAEVPSSAAAGKASSSSSANSAAEALSPKPGCLTSPKMLRSPPSAKNLQAHSNSSRIPAGPAAKQRVQPCQNLCRNSTEDLKANNNARPSTSPEHKAKPPRASTARIAPGSSQSNSTKALSAITAGGGAMRSGKGPAAAAAVPGEWSTPSSPGISRCSSAAVPVARKVSTSTAAAAASGCRTTRAASEGVSPRVIVGALSASNTPRQCSD